MIQMKMYVFFSKCFFASASQSTASMEAQNKAAAVSAASSMVLISDGAFGRADKYREKWKIKQILEIMMMIDDDAWQWLNQLPWTGRWGR